MFVNEGDWVKVFAIFPRRCYVSGKRIWLINAYRKRVDFLEKRNNISYKRTWWRNSESHVLELLKGNDKLYSNRENK